MIRRRTMGVAVAALALALTAWGLVLAATDPYPAGRTGDPLALNGYPPVSAHLLVTATTNNLQASANVNVNFRQSTASGVVTVSLAQGGTSFNVQLSHQHLDVRSSAESSGPWYDVTTPAIPFFGLSLELTRPDLALVAGLTKPHVTKSAETTTYSYTRRDVALTPLVAPAGAASRLGTVHLTLTVGSQGEVSALALVVRSGSLTSSVVVTVLSYNDPRHVALVPIGATSVVATAQVSRLLAGAGLGSILIPRSLFSSTQPSVS